MMEPNLDVYQMQADLMAQSQGYAPPPPGGYGDYQANLTGMRAAYGDIPAMMMAGAGSAGAAGYGAAAGIGNMFSQVGSRVMPIRYTPPARVNVGFYGQYQQETSFLRGLATTAGLRTTPLGTPAYQYGYYASADMGERVGAGAVAAASVAGGIAMAAPTSYAGALIGGALGAPFGPVGMGVGSALGTLVGGAIGYSGADAFADVVAQRRQMNSFLESSSFRYVGAGSAMADPRLGGGMSAAARRETTDFMRRMDVKDSSLNTEDLFGILQGATSNGLLTGIKDMEGFRSKFKDIVEGVKSITKTLHVTLQEGLQVMKDLKAINIDASQMGTIGFQADVAGKISGRTAHEVLGLGLQGAELFRGTGIDMKIGYQSNVMNIASVRAARDAGVLSQEAIVQAGGEEALAQRMTASGLQFMQSAAGRGFGAAFFNPGMGPAGFNKDSFMGFMQGGGTSMVNLAMKGAANLASPDKLMQYEAYQDKFMSEMGKAFGGDTSIMVGAAAMSEARMLYEAGATKDMKTAFRYTLMKSYGMGPAEADTMFARIENAPNEYRARMTAGQNTAVQRTVDEAMSTVGFGYLQRRAEDYVKGATEPLVRGAENIIEGAREGAIGMWERNVLGLKRMDVTGLPLSGAGDAAVAAGIIPRRAGPTSLDDRWTPTTKAIATAGGTAIGLAGAAAIGGPLGWVAAAGAVGVGALAVGLTSWTPSTGRMIKSHITELAKSNASLRGAVKSKKSSEVLPSEIVVEEDPMSGTSQVISQDDYNNFENIVLKEGMTVDEAAKIVKEGKGVKAKLRSMEDIVYGKDFDAKKGIDEVARKMFGTGFEDLSTGEMAELVTQSESLSKRGVTDVKMMLDQAKEAKRESRRLLGDKAITEGADAYQRLTASTERIARKVGRLDVDAFTPQVAGLLARARTAKTPEERMEFVRKAEEAYYATGKAKAKGQVTHEQFMVMADPSNKSTFGILEEEMNSISGDLKTLEGVQKARGFDTIKDMLAADVDFKGDRDAAMRALDKISTQAGPISDKDMKLLEGSTAGKVLLQSRDISEKLDKAEEIVKKEGPRADRAEIARKAIEGLKLDQPLADSIISSYKSQGVDDTKKMLTGMIAQNQASTTAAGGVRATTGSAEALGAAQGSGQELNAVQMNINVQVLSALNALSQNLTRGK